MIHRYYKDGQKLDVAGLNQIIVLVDRSETELSEIGLNEWRAGLDGPPHQHMQKDQFFYVTSGKGLIKLGDKEYKARPGALAYVPAGLVHQTVAQGEESLCYILYNVFADASKEGHKSFADHIEKVKQTRKRQAQESSAAADEIKLPPDFKLKSPKFINDVNEVQDSQLSIPLIESDEANSCEMLLVNQSGISDQPVVYTDREQCLFVTQGNAVLRAGDQVKNLIPGSLVFIARDEEYRLDVTNSSLRYLCLNIFL